MGGQESAFSQPRPAPPTHHVCFARKHVGNQNQVHQDQAGPPGCFWKQPLPAGLFSVPSGRPTVCVPRAVCGVCWCRARISARFHPWACLSGLNEARDLVFSYTFACFPAPRGCQPEGLMKRSLIAHDSGGWHLSPARWL